MNTEKQALRFRIKEILSEKKMTSKELAEKMGKAPQYVSNIINGGKGASLSTLTDIADALNVEIRDLFATTNSQEESDYICCPHCGKKIKIEKGE